jgi:RNA polymerase sigma factor (sigma-70 family)
MTNGTLSPAPVSQERGSPSTAGPTDGQLLARFVHTCDDAAFAVLVQRYGPMVLGVCRRILGDATDAEDAFQATFLVLVKKARSLEKPDLLGNWLYGVAYRIARKARAQRAKRAQHTPPPAAMSSSDPQLEAVLRELQAQLDEELAQIPTKYRAPLVLCYLEGLSNREAAQRLGWPIGSISHRLARGREMLRDRLQDRHPNASYLVLGALPIWAAASSETLRHLQNLAVKSALSLADDEAAAVIAPTVQAMMNQTLREMGSGLSKRVVLTAAAVVVALVGLVAAAWTTYEAQASSDAAPTAGCCHGGTTTP